MEAAMALLTGVALFLFGVGLMGEELGGVGERMARVFRSGRRGFWLGLLSTAALQSSSAVTVLLASLGRPLGESFPVIMGANVGTTVTAWLQWLNLTAPSLAGVRTALLLGATILYLFRKIRWPVGFCLLLTGMDLMASAAAPLGKSPAFQTLLSAAADPLAALLIGAVTTAVLQSSGAAIGILQGLCAAGQVPVTAVVPLLLGQNIGTCATALLASLPGTREARAVALAHLGFNCAGTAALLPLWLLITPPAAVATPLGVAMVHTGFNLATCALFWALRAAARLLPRPGTPARQ